MSTTNYLKIYIFNKKTFKKKILPRYHKQASFPWSTFFIQLKKQLLLKYPFFLIQV